MITDLFREAIFHIRIRVVLILHHLCIGQVWRAMVVTPTFLQWVLWAWFLWVRMRAQEVM